MYKKNNRRFQREVHDSVLEAFSQSGRGPLLWTGKLLNFSMVGASFLTSKILNKGDYVFARIRIMNKGVMEISGKIIWSKRKSNLNLYGLEFESVKKAR